MPKACVMRNPVTNIAGMLSATDIPDWYALILHQLVKLYYRCFVETGSERSSLTADLEDVEKMHKCSPIAHINNIKTPTLFLIGTIMGSRNYLSYKVDVTPINNNFAGEVDKRVPPSQGLSMYYALRERSVPTR